MSSDSLVQPRTGDDGVAGVIARRRILYVGGFDPRSAGRCRKSFSEALGPLVEVGPLERVGPHVSRWRWRTPASATETSFEFLHWDDLVKRHWRAKSRLGAHLAAMRTLYVCLTSGLIAAGRASAPASYRALLLLGLSTPVAIVFALLAALAVEIVGAHFWRFGGWFAAPALVGLLYLYDRVWRAANLDWAAKSCASLVENARGETSNFEERSDVFAARIADVVREDDSDEIVVVGHSSGALLAMKALGRYLAQGEPHRRLVFASLGNVIPLYTWLEPNRKTLAEGIAVAASPSVDWIDVTSGSDPASACRFNALAGSAVQPMRWEPDFHRILTPEHFRAIRRRPLDFHFQYLKPSDSAEGFDLIRMMCWPRPFFAEAPR